MGGDTWHNDTVPVTATIVSIAGGDSWVGIHKTGPNSKDNFETFQSQVAILGWGYCVSCYWSCYPFLVSIAGGDSWVGILLPDAGDLANVPVSIAGGDSWVGIPQIMLLGLAAGGVSIAGGDSWVGIHDRS